MTVLQEIFEWSQDRPMWQRDALRRLMLNGELSDDDVHDLTEICKMAHGLAVPQEVAPFAKDHISGKSDGGAPVSLESIFHHRGVNALADNQTLKFGQNLTVVYGDNAAGKTGYIRILKSACRARGQEKILGNVVSGAVPLTPAVSIKYKVGEETESREWTGIDEDEFVSRVSVFDTQCAAVYLTERTDVAFRPFELDLFDKLVQACKAIRLQLEREQSILSPSGPIPFHDQIPEGTAAAKLLENITSLTKLEAVYRLTRLSAEEEVRLAMLRKACLDLQTNDPEKLIRQLTLRTERIKVLARHIKKVEESLSTEAVQAVFNARADACRMSEEVERLREATLLAGMLTGTGSESWTLLWEAARKFSEEFAYSDQIFPVVEDEAQCVLCQQDLDHAACHRLQQFESFVSSTAKNEFQEARKIFAQQRKAFVDLNVSTEIVSEILKELRIEHESVVDAVAMALKVSEERRKAICLALRENQSLAPDCPAVQSVTAESATLEKEIAERLSTLRQSIDDEARKKITVEFQELHARKLLSQYEQAILDEIDRKKKYAAYGLCIDDTKTRGITQKSTAVTRVAVTQKLKQSFQDELSKLQFRHVEVELKEVGGTEGVLYHKLILMRAPNTELPRIVSEGEQRCLSLAAFFAELSTADDPSGIVFDDPISSLDCKWREGVARRLVEEAKTRQVIVFTHDVVFLLWLKQFAEQQSVAQLDQHVVRQLSKGAGVCVEELPWIALPIRKKIGHLKKGWQAADKIFRDGHQSAYEEKAAFLYGLLREAWERALEEVLLCGTVERFRFGVQTRHIGEIADICLEDCVTLDAAMSKCSQWLPGHDQAAAARAPAPEPAELKTDIEALENWVSKIRQRRNKTGKTVPA